MRSHRFSKDILDFLRLAARNGVLGLIVGGEAVIYHGHLRLTGDTDYYYDLSPHNARNRLTTVHSTSGGPNRTVSS